MDVRSHKEANDGTTFLLTAVDVFSKVGWAIPLRTKTGREVSNALRGLFAGYRVRAFQTDKGKEFLNKDVESVLRDANVKSFVSQDDVVKASIVERFNKTLRAKIHRYLTYTGGSRFIDVLPDIVDAYNRSTHASTGHGASGRGSVEPGRRMADALRRTRTRRRLSSQIVDGGLR